MLEPCDNFGWMSGGSAIQAGEGVDGLDIAMAYMLATSRDVLGQPPSSNGNCTTANPGGYDNNLPFLWYHTDGYFDTTLSPPTWEFISDEDREDSLDKAASAQYRLIGAWPLLWLGVFEKIVYLLVTFAQGLSFVSFGVAAIFAFFKRTEAIARSVVDLWIEIIITSVVIALSQALIVSLALAAAATQNPLASIGVGLLCAVLMVILLFSAMKLVWNALTRIFSAISQASGGAILSPQQVAAGATVGAVGAVAAVATGGGALALAGAAMTGMSAAGVGGPAMGMAGGQLMLAGRMSAMSGTHHRDSGGGNTSHLPDDLGGSLAPHLLSAEETGSGTSPATSKGNVAARPYAPMPSPTSQPILVSGYDPADLSPGSVLGYRTSRIQGHFTPIDIAEGEETLTSTAARQIMAADSRRDDAAEQARLTADNAHDDLALRSTIEDDNLRDETTAQARQDTDNIRDDAALQNALNTTPINQPIRVDSSGLEQAGRELSAAANSLRATAQQQYSDRVTGQMEVRGSRNVGSVVADAVDMEREYRQRMNKPSLEGAGESFGSRMAQAVGIEPSAGQAPITDAARFHALGDQALRAESKCLRNADADAGIRQFHSFQNSKPSRNV